MQYFANAENLEILQNEFEKKTIANAKKNEKSKKCEKICYFANSENFILKSLQN